MHGLLIQLTFISFSILNVHVGQQRLISIDSLNMKMNRRFDYQFQVHQTDLVEEMGEYSHL